MNKFLKSLFVFIYVMLLAYSQVVKILLVDNLIQHNLVTISFVCIVSSTAVDIHNIYSLFSMFNQTKA